MSLKKNTIANFLGQGCVALMNIVFVPIYIKYLGIEAYGLIGVFAMLQAWFGLLDIGMTPTLNREMARFTAGAHNNESIWNLLRSFEVIGFTIAIMIVFLTWICAKWFSVYWLNTEKLPPEVVAKVISIIGFVIALRFIEGIYKGAILGVQKQVLLNVVSSGLAILRGGGAVIVLMWVSPSIETFFVWQGLVSILTILIFIFITYRYLPSFSQPAKFSLVELKKIWRFAGGMLGTTVAVLLLVQVDKVILSHTLSLEIFGYYTLAGTVVSVLYLLTGPISQACFPAFTKFASKDNVNELIELYHQSAQLVGVLIFPAALMLVFFGERLLVLWSGNAALAHNVAPLLSVMAVGTALNCLMHIPYQLTLAYGWSSLGMRQNIIAVLLLVPAILWVVPRYGAIGAAWIWVALNLGYVLICIYFIHTRLLPREKAAWYINDVFFPALGAISAGSLFWLWQPTSITGVLEFVWLLFVGLVMLIGAAFFSPIIRKKFLMRIIYK